MSKKDDDKKLKGITDLLAERNDKASQPAVSEDVTAQKRESKIKEIRIKELEKETAKTAQALRVKYINLVGFPINSDAINSITKETANKERVVCFSFTDQTVNIATTNPQNPELKKILAKLAKKTISGKGEIYLVSENSLLEALKLYEKFPPPREVVTGVKITGKELKEMQKELKNFGVLNAKLNEEKNMTNIFKMILAGAMESNASDIHIEPEDKKIILRYRVDGVLHVVASLEKQIWSGLSSRVKGIAGLKINITEKPQDGRITVFLQKDDKMEIRVSALPTSFGESLVLRLLRSNVTSLAFEDLGFRGKAAEDLATQVARPTGMVVTTGPTGSGKTTTLYAILNKLNNPETKIITLEDPIEYKLEGITQSQIEQSKGYSFADGLRSILRQDPDIIMVGELRDLETVEVSIQASLTGHKVISTLHTNDATGAIPRFLSMGAKPYVLAPALNAIIGQRLVRKVHDKCKIEEKIDPKILERAKEILANLPSNSGYQVDLDNLKFYRGQGCDECNHIGLKGRIGIYEIFTINEKIFQEINQGKTSEAKIAALAHEAGMISMVQDGLLKALDGLTTIEEVFRVIE